MVMLEQLLSEFQNNKLLRRSVKHLFPIEVQQEASPDDAPTGSNDTSPPIGQTNSSTSDYSVIGIVDYCIIYCCIYSFSWPQGVQGIV